MSRDPQRQQQVDIAEAYQEATNKDRQEKDGVVVTPPEIVDFMNHAVAHVLKEHFGTTLDDPRVTITDGFAGTGIFGARMIQTALPEQAQGIVDNLECFEIDPVAADIAENNIRTVATQAGATPPDRRIVNCQDTFQAYEDNQ